MKTMNSKTEEEEIKERTLLDKLGGRKAMAFYATLLVLFILALINKAHAEIISAIDSLFLIFAGSNVMKAKTQQTEEKKKEGSNGIQDK
jgi:1,4-dihydroxy-2-naphthoate octaprenyltransferase